MLKRVTTDIFCPHCAERIDLSSMLCPERLLLAISLQAERYGTEIHCRNCGLGFVYTRIRPKAGERRLRPHFGKAAAPPERHRPHVDHRAKPA